ncbi:MAG TPA: hypothetical protein VGB79_05870 [Allosphingosinicella sp.]|jgi:hypothetical protein
MKKILLTAAALTLGTSAYAWTEMHEGAHQSPAAAATWQGGAKADSDGMIWADADMKSKAAVGGVMAAAAGADAGFAKTADASFGDDMAESDGLAWADADIKSKDMVGGVSLASGQSASGEAWSGAKSADDGGLTWADADIKSKETVGGAAMASADGSANVGQGGPLEPRGYPACRPGRGDDNCIQLYERGVSADLAAWKASDAPAMGMGGPLEPAAGAKAEAAPAPAAPGGAKVADEGDEEEVAAAADAPKGTGAADPHAGHDMNGAKPATTTPTPN